MKHECSAIAWKINIIEIYKHVHNYQSIDRFVSMSFTNIRNNSNTHELWVFVCLWPPSFPIPFRTRIETKELQTFVQMSKHYSKWMKKTRRPKVNTNGFIRIDQQNDKSGLNKFAQGLWKVNIPMAYWSECVNVWMRHCAFDQNKCFSIWVTIRENLREQTNKWCNFTDDENISLLLLKNDYQ